MINEKCKDCEYWVDDDYVALRRQSFKHCHGIDWSDMYDDRTQMFISCDEGIYHIETSPDFGCINFKNKELRDEKTR